MQVQAVFQLRKAAEHALDDIPADLGPGERETIALAIETRADLVIRQ
jgi:predicted nucleic acid-binding protein